jgi:uncharacterized protein with beta-barrel porin domain
MIKAFIAAGLILVLAAMFAVTMPAQSFAQVNGGNGAVDATDRGGGGGGGFGGGTGGSGANGGSNGSIGTGGNGAGLGGGGAGIGGGGGGFNFGANAAGSPGSGTINGLGNSGTISGGSGGSDGGGGGAGIGGGGGDGNGGSAGGAAGFAITNSTIINAGSIVGGAGGSGSGGGNGGAGIGNGGAGVSGGAGGAGLNGLTIFNSSTISGGNGGASFGTGGAGIVGSDMTIMNSGTISGGLSGNGVTRADAIVFTGGTNFLGGTGTVGSFTMISGGTFAPGSGAPGSSMTVAGNLAFQSGAIYLVQLNPTTASFANVTGTATLGGATVNAVYASGSYISKQYTILTAGHVNGTFGSLTNTNLPANFTTNFSYDPTHAYLNLALNFVPGPSFGSGLNVNQQNVANTLTNFFNTTGSIPMAFGTLSPAGLTQISGETATGSQQTTFDAMNLFMGTMLDPFNRGPASGMGSGASGYASEGDSSAYASDGRQRTGPASNAYAMFTKAPVAPAEQRWSTWVAGFGGSQSTDGNAAVGSSNTTSSVYGTAVGADYRFSPNTLAGFALAGGGTNFSVANSGSGHSDLFQFGTFVKHTVGPAYISAALAYGWQDITTNRTVTAAGSDQLRAQFDANAFSGRLEGGYRFVAPWVDGIGITPYAAAQFTTFDLPAYAEQAIVGSNAFALAYGAKDVTDTRSELGIRTDKSFALSDGVLILRSRFAWAHDFDPDRSIGATFQTLPGASFVVNGAAQASDSALVTAGLEKKWLNGWSAAATFEGEFSDVTRSYAGKGVVRYQW